MRSRPRIVQISAVLAAALALAACTQANDGGPADPPTSPVPSSSQEPSESPSESVSPSASASPSDSPSAGVPTDEAGEAAAPPFGADTSEDTAEGAGEPDLMLTDVRTGAHDGFDRVVIEFLGSSTPGWSAKYVLQAVQDGSGEQIDVAGDAVLALVVSNTRYPNENEPGYYDGPRSFDPQLDQVGEVYVDGTYEGLTQIVIGVAGTDAPFRVFALTNPVRVVVDIQHQG